MLACLCHFVISFFRLFALRSGGAKKRNNARRKDEITKKLTANYRKDEITPGEKTKRKSLKWRYFAWRLFVFSRSFFVISRDALRYFVFSPGVISSFRYFAWLFFVISSFRLALFRLGAAP